MKDPSLIFSWFWPFRDVIIYLTLMLPVWLFVLTLYMSTSIHINFWCEYSWTVLISGAFKSMLSQSRCPLEPNNFLRGLRWGAQTPQVLHLLFRWLCSQLVFMIYILDKIKWYGTKLFSRESNIWYYMVFFSNIKGATIYKT